MTRNILIPIIFLMNILTGLSGMDKTDKNVRQSSDYKNCILYFTFSEKHKNSDHNGIENGKILDDLISQFWQLGKEIHFIDSENIKSLKQSADSNIFIVKIQQVNEYYNPHKQHGRPKKPDIVFSYYSFDLLNSYKSASLIKVPTSGNHLDTLEIVTAINMIQFIIREGYDGLNLKELSDRINAKDSSLVVNNLYVSNKIYGQSVTKNLNFPSAKIINVSQSEILNRLKNKAPDSFYAINIYEPDTRGSGLDTVIMNCETSEPVYIQKLSAK
jgi:hypothetical protein